MQLTSESIPIPHFGHVGDFLCWAETGASIGEFYTAGIATPFCRYLSRILQKTCCNGGPRPVSSCDVPGHLATALDQALVDVGDAPSSFSFVDEELRGEGRPLAVVSGGASFHAMAAVGVLDQNGVKGIELLDPIGSDFRRLYLWSLYQERLHAGLLRQSSTLPREPRRLSARRVSTKWASENLLGDRWEKVPFEPPPSTLRDALAPFFDSVEAASTLAANPFVYLPLIVAMLGAGDDADSIVDQGWRCFFRLNGEDSVAIDVFERNGSAAVGRINTGRLVTQRVSLLRQGQEGSLSSKRLVGFKEWLNLGLDTVVLDEDASQNAGEILQANDTRSLWLFGPRDYLDLGREGPGAADQNEQTYLRQLKNRLAEVQRR